MGFWKSDFKESIHPTWEADVLCTFVRKMWMSCGPIWSYVAIIKLWKRYVFYSCVVFDCNITYVPYSRCLIGKCTKFLYLSYQQAAKVQVSLCICAVSPEPSLLACTVLRLKIGPWAPLDTPAWVHVRVICVYEVSTKISCAGPNNYLLTTITRNQTYTTQNNFCISYSASVIGLFSAFINCHRQIESDKSFSHTNTYKIEWSLCKLAVGKICPTSLPMWDKRN